MLVVCRVAEKWGQAICYPGLVVTLLPDTKRLFDLVHRFGHWSNFVVVELARYYGRASSATTKKLVSGRNDEQGQLSRFQRMELQLLSSGRKEIKVDRIKAIYSS
ncbi:MAG: hypothetical protein QME81_20945 [bacterium]|nr:hypothetical protein [bacterium]